MRGLLGVALAVELRKLVGATVTRVATVATLVLVLVTSAGGYAAARRSPDSDLGRKAATMVLAPGWEGYTGLAATSVGITTLLAVAVVMAWVAGREFTDGSIVGLFALPVSTGVLGAAKATVTAAWATALAAAAGGLVAVAGLLLGLPPGGATTCAVTVSVVGAVLGLAALPVMWVATAGRGYLAGIGAALALVVVTNVAAGFGLGRAIPWAIPVLWATPGSGVPSTALLAPAVTALAGAALVSHAWSRLQLGNR